MSGQGGEQRASTSKCARTSKGARLRRGEHVLEEEEGSKECEEELGDMFNVANFKLIFVWNLASEAVEFSPEKKKKLHRQRKLSLHQLRKERHIGSKSRESPSPEDERGVNVDQVGFGWQHAAPGHQWKNDHKALSKSPWGAGLVNMDIGSGNRSAQHNLQIPAHTHLQPS
eukprot:1160781-Pelagomonas_calceolata.AAC.1